MADELVGGGTGIGLYIAKALEHNGAAAVYIVGRRKEVLESAAKQAKHGKIIPLPGDVTSKDSLHSIANQVRQQHGHINIIFANSGITGPNHTSMLPTDRQVSVKEFAELMWRPPMEDFTQALHVNVTAAFYTAIAFLELLDAGNQKCNVSQKSQIVMTSSIAGFNRKHTAGYAYAASKAGATHLVKQLATSFAPYMIRVNAIAPGLYLSEMTAHRFSKDASWEGAVPAEAVPLKRTGAEEDMAGTAIYLASRAGAYLDGNILVSDGGRLSITPASY